MRLEIRTAEKRDLAEIKRLIDIYIAEDYYSLDSLEPLLHGEQNYFYVVTDRDRDNAVISFFFGFISTMNEALRILHVAEKPESLKNYSEDTPVGVYKIAGTEKAYQKHGICSSFIHDLEPVFQERGAKLILATALRPLGREVPMRHIFRNNGFAAAEEIKQPWVELYLYCPYCNRHHCICNAVLYMKKLGASGGEDFSE